MAVHALTLAALMEDLDGGRIHEAFAQELKRVVMDCDDRPGDKKPRKVLLQLDIAPIIDEHGNLDSVAGAFQIKSTVPQRKSKVYSFGVRQGGQLVFNDLSDDNINQRTLDE